MQLSGLTFIYFFLPALLLVYYFPPIYKRNFLKNTILLLASLGFYAWTSSVSLLFLLASIVINYFLGIWVGKYAKSTMGKRIVFLSCVLNLVFLVFFKMSLSLSGGLADVFGVQLPDLLKNIAMPLGISFYTFKTLSYIVDVYRKKVPSQKNFINLGLYLSFFPCAISGPIFKYNDMISQIEERECHAEKFSRGVRMFIVGMAKSVILGTQLLMVSNFAFGAAPDELSVFYAWLGAFAYTLFIYFDFSGYSDMAIGVGKMFGFEIPQNFNYPYISRSVSEYWRRWHITLGEWFQEYLYYPLSLGPALKIRKLAGRKLNRKHAGMVSIGFTLFIVWLCTGVWHGFNMTFVVWGLLNFVFVFIDTYFKPSKYTKLTSVCGFIGTSVITLFTKVIFNSGSIGAAFSYIAAMLHLNGNELIDSKSVILLKNYFVYIIVGLVFVFPVIQWLNRKISSTDRKSVSFVFDVMRIVVIFGLFIVALSFVHMGNHNPPMYANF